MWAFTARVTSSRIHGGDLLFQIGLEMEGSVQVQAPAQHAGERAVVATADLLFLEIGLLAGVQFLRAPGLFSRAGRVRRATAFDLVDVLWIADGVNHEEAEWILRIRRIA